MNQHKAEETQHQPTVNAFQRLLTKAMQPKAMFDGFEKPLNAPPTATPLGDGATLERARREDKPLLELAIAFEVKPGNPTVKNTIANVGRVMRRALRSPTFLKKSGISQRCGLPTSPPTSLAKAAALGRFSARRQSRTLKLATCTDGFPAFVSRCRTLRNNRV
jgi:hypothetical protein